MSDLTQIHFAVEALLAGAVWLLCRRSNRFGRLLAAFETEHQILKRSGEAAVSALDHRVGQIERAATDKPRSSRPLALRPLSRGEMDFLRKVREAASRPPASATQSRTLASPRL